MNKTTNFDFNLPEDDDFYDIEQQNENWQKTDEELQKSADLMLSVDSSGYICQTITE